MPADFIHILVSGQCARCGGTVRAAIGEVRATGVFDCDCGNLTRARYVVPDPRPLFRGADWR